jgi:SAM-dependent methyltransferase
MTYLNCYVEGEKSKHIKYAIDNDVVKVEVLHTIKALLKAVADISSGKLNFKVMDFGCGRGELMAELQNRGYETYGIDIDPVCVQLSSNFGRVRQGTIEDLPTYFEPGFFDLVIASHVLEHLPAPGQALREWTRLATAGVLVAVPNPCYPPQLTAALLRRALPVNRGHWYSWDYAHFTTFVENCGLTIKQWYHDSVALPFPQGKRKLLGFKTLCLIEGKILRAVFPRFSRSIIAHVVPKP